MKVKKEWIQDELTEDALTLISEFSKDLATSDKSEKGWLQNNDVKTSKIRRFYGEVKRIQARGIANEKPAFRMLKPKLAYAVGRETVRDAKLRLLFEVLSVGIDSVEIDKINDPKELNKRFSNLVQLFEAIVAFHKYHGGKD